MNSDARLRELALAATPGPWHSAGGYVTVRDPANSSFGLTIYHIDEMGQRTPQAAFQAVPFARSQDASYIAACHPQAILALLDAKAAAEQAADMRGRELTRAREALRVALPRLESCAATYNAINFTDRHREGPLLREAAEMVRAALSGGAAEETKP